MTRPSDAAPRRRSIALRTLLVTLGAYGLTALITACLSLLLAELGMDRVEAIIAATLASFAIFAGIAMAVHHARSAGRAALWLVVIAVPVGVAILLMMRASGTA